MADKVKVLVADDEQNVVDFIADLLSQSHFEVSKAFNGKGVLDSLQKSQPDIILLDITMPDMNGFEVCEAIRKSPEHASLPILMITGNEDETAIVKALESGADDYITKPFKNENLVHKIETLLDQAKSNELPSRHYLSKLQSEKEI